MPADPPGREHGFTLIETIVALVILSVTIVAFFAFLSNALSSAHRMERASVAYDRRTNALEVASAINPMLLPQGTIKLGPYRISWTSGLVGDIHQSSRYPAGTGIFKVALYRMTFSFPDAADIPPIEVTKLGYRRDDVPDFLPSTAAGQTTAR